MENQQDFIEAQFDSVKEALDASEKRKKSVPEGRENNRLRILNTAVTLFSRKGYEGGGVQEICEAAGVTKPTLYYYFKSKRGLLEAIVESYGKELVEGTRAAAFYEHDFIRGLSRMLRKEVVAAVWQQDFYNLHNSLMNGPMDCEGTIVYAPVIRELEKIYDDFFMLSSLEFGNMKGKEKLFAKLFHQNIMAVARSVCQEKISFDDDTVYKIIRAFVYGVAN